MFPPLSGFTSVPATQAAVSGDDFFRILIISNLKAASDIE